MRYFVDTNVFIDAFLNPAENDALERFHGAFAPDELLSAIVVHELRAGIRSPSAARKLERYLIAPFRRRNRLVSPTAQAWEATAAALAKLARLEGARVSNYTRAFGHDALLAASCREAGATLVTRNTKDFARLRRVMDFRFMAPWPMAKPR